MEGFYMVDKWELFNCLTKLCYENIVGPNYEENCWHKGYEVLKDIVKSQRISNESYGKTVEELDVETDNLYYIEEWVNDYIDEMLFTKEYDLLLKVCDELFDLFDWPLYTGSTIKLGKCRALCYLKEVDKADVYSKLWYKNESENIQAGIGRINVCIFMKEYEEAYSIVLHFLDGLKEVDDEYYELLEVTSLLFGRMGKLSEQALVDKAIDDLLQIQLISDDIV